MKKTLDKKKNRQNYTTKVGRDTEITNMIQIFNFYMFFVNGIVSNGTEIVP